MTMIRKPQEFYEPFGAIADYLEEVDWMKMEIGNEELLAKK